jgi:hypothetical protein
MKDFLESFLEMTRGTFSREAACGWFVIAFAGLAIRSDWLGVTSIIRALDLSPGVYECLLHFFHASSWSGPDLLSRCVHWLLEKENERLRKAVSDLTLEKLILKEAALGTAGPRSETSEPRPSLSLCRPRPAEVPRL